MKIRIFLSLLCVVSGFANTTNAKECEQAPYNDFDFWIGEWLVTTPDGKQAGKNSVQKAYNNCVITEHYETSEGSYGTSINIYDKNTEKWYQTWVDKSRLRLQLVGEKQGDIMLLSGETMTKDGLTIEHKISWTPKQNGSVIQHWEVRKADDENWQTLFKGTYKRQS